MATHPHYLFLTNQDRYISRGYLYFWGGLTKADFLALGAHLGKWGVGLEILPAQIAISIVRLFVHKYSLGHWWSWHVSRLGYAESVGESGGIDVVL